MRSNIFGLLIITFLSKSACCQLITTCEEVSPDVVCTTVGSADLTGLTKVTDTLTQPQMRPVNQIIITGLSGSQAVDIYQSMTSPGSFGTGGTFFANSGTGPTVGAWTATQLAVPDGYVSGTTISTSTATFNNQTFATMGLNPGTSFTWTWGAAGPGQQMTLSAIPEPSSVAFLGLVGVGCLIGGWYRRGTIKD